MPFQKGHAPVNGHAGGTKASAKAARRLAAEVRERIAPEAWVDYHKAIAMSRINVRWDEDDDGNVFATWDDEERGGVRPTLAERTASVNWLADRGHGMPVQSLHLEADLRATVTHVELPAGALSLANITMIRGMLAARAGVGTSSSSGTAPPRVLEATSVEREPAPVTAPPVLDE